MSEPLDALDVRILDLLQDDVTLPVAEIAERVASSKTVVWRRMQKLVDSGVIRERMAIVDHHKRSEEHTSELQSLMRISYAVFCLKKKKKKQRKTYTIDETA